MLSFVKKNSNRIARVEGPDIEEFIYIEDTHLQKKHLDAYNACQLLAESSNYKVQRSNAETVDLLPISGRYLQFYGKNKVALSPDRPEGQTHVISLFGSPGSGKSTWIGKYMDDYKSIFPDGKIIVISRKTKEDEPEFRQDYQQLDIDDDFLETPFSIDDIKDYQKTKNVDGFVNPFLVIYDDTSTFAPKIQKKIQESLEDLIKVGRSFNVTVIVSSHVINDGLRTKVLHANSTHSVFFIQSHKEKVEECFRHRLKFKQDLTDFLLDQKSRWVCIANNYPQYVVTENMVATLNGLTDYLKRAAKKG